MDFDVNFFFFWILYIQPPELRPEVLHCTTDIWSYSLCDESYSDTFMCSFTHLGIFDSLMSTAELHLTVSKYSYWRKISFNNKIKFWNVSGYRIVKFILIHLPDMNVFFFCEWGGVTPRAERPWATLGHHWTILGQPEPPWTILGYLGQPGTTWAIWTILGQREPPWTILDHPGPS